mgnify:CR=1 FL=1
MLGIIRNIGIILIEDKLVGSRLNNIDNICVIIDISKQRF